MKKRHTSHYPQSNSRHHHSSPASRRKIRYAVVGLGHIAQNAILPAFAHARENSELVALVSDDKTKLRALSREYGVENCFTYNDYELHMQAATIHECEIANCIRI